MTSPSPHVLLDCLLEAEHSTDDLRVCKSPHIVTNLSPDVVVVDLYTTLADAQSTSFGD